MLERLVFLVSPGELVCEQQADVVLVGTEIGEFLQRAKRLLHLAGLLHAVGVFEKIQLGVGLESLRGTDLPELVVHGGPTRRRAQDLVAQGDRVVEEASLGVQVNGALEQGHGLRRRPLAEEQVRDPVVQADVHLFLATAIVEVEDLPVRRDSLVELLPLLELGGLLLQRCDV